MTDIRDLLRDAAPEPRQPLDFAALRARSEGNRRSRLIAWFTPLVAAVAATAALGQGALNPAGPAETNAEAPTTVTTAPESVGSADQVSTTTTALGPPPVGSESTADAGRPRRDDTDTAEPAGAPASEPAAQPAPNRPHDPYFDGWPDDPAYPRRPGCSVDDAGLAPGAERRCQYTASESGGAYVDRQDGSIPSAGTADRVRVTVLRPTGETSEWTGGNSYEVGEAGVFMCGYFIAPGDRVEVVLVAGDDQRATTLHAGAGWCG